MPKGPGIRRQCPVCSRLIPLRADGTFRAHYARLSVGADVCLGSRKRAPRA